MSVTTLRSRRRRRGAPIARWETKTDLLAGGSAVLSAEYARASSNPRKKSKSVPDQHEWNRQQIEAHRWRLAGSFEDDNKGASYTSVGVREGYEELCELIDTGTLDVLVVWDISRQQRDLEVYVHLRARCLRAGLFYWLVGKNLYDLRDKTDRLRLNIDASIAEFTTDAIRENVILAIVSNAKEGKPHGKAPFGYRRTYDQHSRALIRQEPDEKVRRTESGREWSPAGVIRWCYESFLAGTSLMALADELNEAGIPCPRMHAAREEGTPKPPEHWATARWWAKTVRDLLLNPAMIGQRVLDGELMKEGAWVRMISDDRYFTTAAKLLDPRRKTIAQQSTAKYLLSGIGQCDGCGSSVGFLKYNERHHMSYDLYKCRSRRGCCAIEAPALEAYAVAWMLEWLCTDGRIQAIRDLDEDASAEAAKWHNEVARLEGELDELRAALDDAEVQLSMTAFARREAALLTAIGEASEKARAVGLAPELRRFEGLDAEGAWAIWDGLELPVQRAILRDLVEIRVRPVGRGRRDMREIGPERVVITPRLPV